MKITLIVDEKDFDQEVASIIKERVKTFVRGDEKIQKIIAEVIDVEVKNKVNRAFDNINVEGIVRTLSNDHVKSLLPLRSQVAAEAYKAVHDKIHEIMGGNEEAIKRLFEEEIKFIQGK